MTTIDVIYHYIRSHLCSGSVVHFPYCFGKCFWCVTIWWDRGEAKLLTLVGWPLHCTLRPCSLNGECTPPLTPVRPSPLSPPHRPAVPTVCAGAARSRRAAAAVATGATTRPPAWTTPQPTRRMRPRETKVPVGEPTVPPPPTPRCVKLPRVFFINVKFGVEAQFLRISHHRRALVII